MTTMTKPERIIPLGTPGLDVCDVIDPTIACGYRHSATQNGRFWASRMGWVWSDGANGHFTITACPWCQGKLPELTPAILAALTEPDDGTKKKNLLANRTATVAINRNGLSMSIDAVPAADAELVAQALLDSVRNLVDAGYDELVQDGGSLHGGGFDTPDDDESFDTLTDPPSARRRPVIGFHAKRPCP